MKAKIVVDLGFGDSGKGAAIDGLAMVSNNPVGIRFSGGHQCGHTVYTTEDTWHIHSSFSSVALRGFPSYVAHECCCYPPQVVEEANVLKGKQGSTEITFHPLVRVSTPYDIAWNRVTEGVQQHGSVGLGVGATMSRNINTGHKLYMIDLIYNGIFLVKLEEVRKYYLDRMSKDYPGLIEQFNNIIEDEMFSFLKACRKYTNWCCIAGYEYLSQFGTLLFEGSQGILLDMNHGTFPNVTYAETTGNNALRICMNFHVVPEIYYVTRCYSTRHGNGWMPNEEGLPLVNTEAEINLYDTWQKEFRMGELNYDLLNYALNVDNIYSQDLDKYIIVSCLDQRPDFVFDVDKILVPVKGYYYRSSPVSVAIDGDYTEEKNKPVSDEFIEL